MTLIAGRLARGSRAVFSAATLSLTIALLSLPEQAHAEEVVGATAGELGVSAEGSAHYSIAIAVPSGTTGVQPKLDLRYDSQAGNGVLGVGFSLGGLSSISRCGKTLPIDGTVTAVDYSSNDRFCLDGQRLVPVSGTYGADGTEYRTYFDEASRIVSYGAAGSGPEKFKVWTKAGEILEFGYTADARIEGPGRSDVRSWALNKLSDTAGNYIEFKYSENSTTGEFHIDEISYTGNEAQGLQPYNRVDFTYETRPDTIKAYVAGGAADLSQRLINVKVYAENALFRDYRIAYGMELSGRSRISSITECATDTACFKPTTFAWSGDGTAAMTAEALTENNVPGGYNEFGVVASGDFNKDGLTDLYWTKISEGRVSNTTQYVWLAEEDGSFSQSTTLVSSAVPVGYVVAGVGDFNGDGLADFYAYDSDSKKRADGNPNDYAFLSNGDGTFAKTFQTQGITGSEFNEHKVLAMGDFNGDGITDLYLAETQDDGPNKFKSTLDHHIFLGNSDGIFSNAAVSGPALTAYESYGVSASGDFNGDGLTDLYLTYQKDDGRASGSKADTVWLAKPETAGAVKFSVVTLTIAASLPNDRLAAGSGDFNGDGLADLYVYNADSYRRAEGDDSDYVALAKGDGTFSSVTLTGDGITGSALDEFKALATADFTGDGLADVYLGKVDSNGRIRNSSGYLLVSKGNGRFANTPITITGAPAPTVRSRRNTTSPGWWSLRRASLAERALPPPAISPSIIWARSMR
jgi:hypothetical protein